MTGQPVGPGRPGRGRGATRGSRFSLVLIFAIGLIPVVALGLAWARGDRTDISLDIPRACSVIDASVIARLTPDGTAVPSRSTTSSSANDSCTVDTTDADLHVSVGADAQAFDPGYRASTCSQIAAKPTTSGPSITCASTRTTDSQARIDEYVWVRGVYEVNLSYRRVPPGALPAHAQATTDGVIARLVAALPAAR